MPSRHPDENERVDRWRVNRKYLIAGRTDWNSGMKALSTRVASYQVAIRET